jgi:transcriptional regulator with XRE-family HTH domain
MFEPTAFGCFLKEKRKIAGLRQNELSAAIGKTGQYISNIEKGKNNAPPNDADIEKLIMKLELSENDAQLFRSKAAADRNNLPKLQMNYILKHDDLLRLIYYGEKNHIGNEQWRIAFNTISGGNNNEIK